MSTIRILADDLTGALDTSAAFAGVLPVFIDRPPAVGEPYFNATVSVVATPSRDVPVDRLPALLQPVLDWFGSGSVAFKKVDSLLRGNTFPEIAWLMQYGHFDRAVFAPAFPAQGRITVDDHQWVVKPGADRQAVATPLRESFARLGLVSAPASAAGTIWIPEVSSDDGLDAVAAKALRENNPKQLWAGSAGLAFALARCAGLAPVTGAASPLPLGSGPSVLVSASFQSVLRQQWAMLEDNRQGLCVAHHASNEELTAVLDLARHGEGDLCFDLSPLERVGTLQATEQLTAQTARLVAELPIPGQLIVVGGDTVLGLCRASGANGFLAHPAIRPGWGCARLIGGVWDSVPCYTRSGAFGSADDLLMMIRLLDGSDNRRKGN